MDGLRGLAAIAGVAMLGMAALASLPQLHDTTQRIALAIDSLRPATGQSAWLEVASLKPEADTRLAKARYRGDPLDLPDQDSLEDTALVRLRHKIPDELYSYFDVYLYVSKAGGGSLAQHMYIFNRDDDGNLAFEQSFPVSTGRERHERYRGHKYFTNTPAGLFELDPNRFERSHYSRQWHSNMPYSMFLNASIDGRQTGIALHSSGRSHMAELGSRASGGCVRLPPKKAAELFRRFKKFERGDVPVFAYDPDNNRTSGDGVLQRNADGTPVLTRGYKVLLFIENYKGGPAIVAVL